MNTWHEPLLEVACRAPSGDNTQPWRFIVEYDTIALDIDPDKPFSEYGVDSILAQALVNTLNLEALGHLGQDQLDFVRRDVAGLSSDTPIVSYLPGEKDELKPGAAIFIAAAVKQPDGTLQAPRVNVGRGVAPPM